MVCHPVYTIQLKVCHCRFGEVLETACSPLSFWYGGEGCEVAVSTRAPASRFAGSKYAAGRDIVFSERCQSSNAATLPLHHSEGIERKCDTTQKAPT